MVAALVLGGVGGWLLFGDHGSGRSARTPQLVPPKLGAVAYPTLGLSVGKPASWHASLQSGVVKLLSSDQAASIAISAPAPAHQDAQLRRTDVTELRRLFKPSRLLGRQRGRLGVLPALTTELVGTSPRHTKIRIFSTAVSSAYRSYSVQIFTALRPSAQTLIGLRSVLESVRFSAPKK